MNSYHSLKQAYAAFAHPSVITEATSYLSLFDSEILAILGHAPVRNPYRDNPLFYYEGFDTPPSPHATPSMFGSPIPYDYGLYDWHRVYSDVPYDYGLYAWPRVYSDDYGLYAWPRVYSDDYGLYAWPRVLYSPISSFHLGSYGDVWSPPNASPHCTVANESTGTRFFNSSLFHASHERSYPPKPPIFQIYLQGVFNNFAGATINGGENSGNRYTYYDNHGGNSINNSGTFIGNGNGSSIGGDFDTSTRNYY